MRWTDAEDAVVRDMYATHTRGEIASRLGRTEGMVRSRCWTLGLNSKANPWTDEEVAMLRDCYSRALSSASVGPGVLAARLGRHRANVARKARTLGIVNIHPYPRKKRSEQLSFAGAPASAVVFQSAGTKTRLAMNGHPRGALGMKHTDEARRRQSTASRAMWADPNSKLNSPEAAQRRSDQMIKRIVSGEMRSGHTRCRGGKRADLGNIYFRSSWEANYARYLNLLMAHGKIAAWEYECKTFVFEAIKRGTRAYTPDFKVTMPNGRHEWHEVKGWMDAPSKTRLARMAKYYPGETVIVIGASWFKAANRNTAPLIPGWERGTVHV